MLACVPVTMNSPPYLRIMLACSTQRRVSGRTSIRSGSIGAPQISHGRLFSDMRSPFLGLALRTGTGRECYKFIISLLQGLVVPCCTTRSLNRLGDFSSRVKEVELADTRHPYRSRA